MAGADEAETDSDAVRLGAAADSEATAEAAEVANEEAESAEEGDATAAAAAWSAGRAIVSAVPEPEP